MFHLFFWFDPCTLDGHKVRIQLCLITIRDNIEKDVISLTRSCEFHLSPFIIHSHSIINNCESFFILKTLFSKFESRLLYNQPWILKIFVRLVRLDILSKHRTWIESIVIESGAPGRPIKYSIRYHQSEIQSNVCVQTFRYCSYLSSSIDKKKEWEKRKKMIWSL